MAKKKKHSDALAVLKMKDEKTGKPIFSKEAIKFAKEELKRMDEKKPNTDPIGLE
jgi:hypothetical protein